MDLLAGINFYFGLNSLSSRLPLSASFTNLYIWKQLRLLFNIEQDFSLILS